MLGVQVVRYRPAAQRVVVVSGAVNENYAPPLWFEPVMAIKNWRSNGHLIADCARLGYLHKEWVTLDPTYGYGTFWTEWRPMQLVACDLNPEKSPIGHAVDFTALPWPDRRFKASVFDPPYKLNGTPSAGRPGDIDERFGVDVGGRDWKARMRLIVAGAKEVARVTDEYLLVKCQDQVVSAKIRWQTRVVEDAVAPLGFGLKDRFDFLGFRPQPEVKNQLNAWRGSSQLLVFKRGWSWHHEPSHNAEDTAR